jgi:hypothetical protein
MSSTRPASQLKLDQEKMANAEPRQLPKGHFQLASTACQGKVEKQQLLAVAAFNDKPARGDTGRPPGFPPCTDVEAVTVFDSSNTPQPFLDTPLLDRIKTREKAEKQTTS